MSTYRSYQPEIVICSLVTSMARRRGQRQAFEGPLPCVVAHLNNMSTTFLRNIPPVRATKTPTSWLYTWGCNSLTLNNSSTRVSIVPCFRDCPFPPAKLATGNREPATLQLAKRTAFTLSPCGVRCGTGKSGSRAQRAERTTMDPGHLQALTQDPCPVMRSCG